MKPLIPFLGLLLLATSAVAQPVGALLGSGRAPTVVTLGAQYQRYTDQGSVAESSFPVGVVAPIGSHFSMSVQAGYAIVTGAEVEALSGLSDVQASLAYAARLGDASLVASLAANLPSGKQELTSEEFETSILLGNNYYDFRVPSLGQGLNIVPGVTWAVPISEVLVVGLGIAYQVKGAYTPLQEGETYYPGNEILLTGGVDYRLSRTGALSGDMSYTMYGADKWGAMSYTAGDKITASAQYLGLFGFNEVRLLTRYRTRAKSDVPGSAGTVFELPSHWEAAASYRARVGRSYLGAATRLNIFGASSTAIGVAREGLTLVEVRLLPALTLSPSMSVPVQLGYTLGSLSGFEAGIGLVVLL